MRALEESQWWPESSLRDGQRAQLQALARWAAGEVPHYRDQASRRDPLQRLAGAGTDFWDRWREIPILTKSELRAQGAALRAGRMPGEELPLDALRTSGSTGIPVEITRNRATRCVWQALTLRDAYWQKRDFSGRLGAARSLKPGRREELGTQSDSWGAPFSRLHETGPASVIHVGFPIDRIDQWVQAFEPNVLLTYPSVIAGLMELRAKQGAPAGLREVSLLSEPVSEQLVERLETQWCVRCSDMYSANDAGYIALQCGEARKLHVQSESILVEIVRDDGQTCEAGEVGRVLVTPLHNLAMPLLRYEIGDYAVPGEPCACGRAHPVIERVLGRERNLLRRPDGALSWPTGLGLVRKVDAVAQAQYVQTALDRIELRVKLARSLMPGESEALVGYVRRALGYPFDVRVIEVTDIERGPTGKFEEFLSRIGAVTATPTES